MHGRNHFNRFEFDDYSRLDQEIDSQPIIESKSRKLERNTDVPLDVQTPLFEGLGHDPLVNGLQQPWSDFAVKPNGDIHNLPCDEVDGRIDRFHMPLRLVSQ